MQRLITIFRTIIVAGLILAIAGGLIDLVFPDLVPAQINDAYEAYTIEEAADIHIAMGFLALVVLIVVLVATVGLLLLKRWARALAFWVTVVSTLFYPFLGPYLYSGLGLMLTEASMLLWGAVLAMAYFSELRTYFERQPAPEDMT